MIRKYFYTLIFCFSISIYAQDKVDKGTNNSFSNKVVEHFQQINQYFKYQDSVTEDSLYKIEKYKLLINSNQLSFKINELVIKNPFYSDELDVKNYPVSYSVIFNDNLIALFENGKFACFHIETMQRNTEFENLINTKKFTYHWIINGKLCAQSGNVIYKWDNHWIKLKTDIPLKKQPILFEDKEFIVLRDCFGEWGGTIYFFDKASGEIFFTESTCANSVIKEDSRYLVLAHLGHGSGFSELKSIENPRNLTKVNKGKINKTQNGEALGYTDKSNAHEKVIDIYDIQLFSTFKFRDKQLYIAHLHDMTFLVEIEGFEIRIVHPLFGKEVYTHDPITTNYGKYTLMNLDHYGTALDREISVIIVRGDQITKLDWNESHR